jgi:beta-phosphoglucomutase-like phosphatase (HAD superfamily)
MEILYL